MANKFNGFCSEEYPQFKAYNNGLDNLTTVELISLIIGTGTQNNVDQARQIYKLMDENLRNIARARVEDLQVVQGIGDAKAIALQAALELGKRYNLEKCLERPDLGSSLAIYNYLEPHVRDIDVEEAHLLLMNNNYKLIKHVKLGSGGVTEVAIDVRRIMGEAVVNNATIIAIMHNHPSGSPSPSKNDDDITTKVSKACEIMRIMFMDHVIIGDGCYYSYHDRGRLN